MCSKYYDLRYMFYKKNCISSKLARLLDTASKFALFSVSGLKDEKFTKLQTYMKTETHKLYSEYVEYFCQISSKSIFIILSYTISKFARFLRHSV